MKKGLFQKLIILAAVIVVLCGLLACGESQAKTEGYDYSIYGILKNYDDFKIYVDEETGVNYIVYSTNAYKGGITPRYNADGTLYVSEMEGEGTEDE